MTEVTEVTEATVVATQLTDTAEPSQRDELQVNRSSIGESRLVTAPVQELAADHVRLRIEHFALTANNVTYAQFGDMLDYWNFFPVDAQWGRVPAMGWARITQSNVAGLDVGSRFYGWYPMATSIDIKAKPSSAGFRDDGTHRAAQAGAYRSFLRTDLDGLYTDIADEHRHELLRGLYITGFLIDHFFVNQSYLGVAQAIVMSASSKTALGYASRARQTTPHVRLVGVTSQSNREFVETTGAYDQVVSYDELETIDEVGSVIVDMAGSGAAVASLHSRLGDLIAHSMVVGKSHHDAAPVLISGGPQPSMFFAPTAMDACLTQWGTEEYSNRTKSGLEAFIESSKRWLTIEEHNGPDAAQQAWQQLYLGSINPSIGLIATLQS